MEAIEPLDKKENKMDMMDKIFGHKTDKQLYRTLLRMINNTNYDIFTERSEEELRYHKKVEALAVYCANRGLNLDDALIDAEEIK